jgi:hypothetical protein
MYDVSIELLCICVTILQLFSYQLLSSKIEVVLPKFALEPAYFFCLNLCQRNSVSPRAEITETEVLGF